MDEIRYPSIETAILANQAAGESGAILNMNGLDSALKAPRNAAAYEDADLVNQTAILIQRIALNHPFVDGNKRTAFILGGSFLLINGFQFRYRDEQEEMELAATIETMVADKDFPILVEWIENHITIFNKDDRGE